MSLPKVWNLFGEDHLPYRLLLLARMIDRDTQRILQENHGLTVAEWRLLAISCAMGPASASEIGAAGEIDRAEISRAFGKLDEAGLLQREPDPGHGKRQIITPTDKGRELFETIRQERRSYFSRMMEGLSFPERQQFDASLEKVAQSLVQGGRSR